MRWVVWLSLFLNAPVYAHDARPVVVVLTQTQQAISIDVTVPASLPEKALPQVSLNDCDIKVEGREGYVDARYQSSDLWVCPGKLEGRSISLKYPYFNPSLSAVIKVKLNSGASYSTLLSPEQTEWIIPDKEEVTGVITNYIGMGFSHILAGWDHLLFVTCLLLLAPRPRQLLLSVTGFTLGHSVTLALGALKIVTVPAAVFEALIALSLVILATELIQRKDDSWSLRYPVAVTAMFGLIHGLGFASVLQDIGLPQTQLAWGLLSFNVGIELGQLSFIICIATLFALLRRKIQRPSLKPLVYLPVCYGIGLIASFWFWERTYPALIAPIFH